MTSYQYDSNFFDFVDQSSGQSAIHFLSRLNTEFKPGSVLDVGCGRAVWLAAWEKLGVKEILGIDGAYVDQTKLHISHDLFEAKDISRPFLLKRKFDLVQCLEVAEHIPEESADILVQNLVNHSAIVLFSAAQPGQGGEFHVNEKPAAYWMRKFEQHGYEAFDYPRQVVKNVKHIEPWYRYNAILFASKKGQKELSQNVLSTHISEDISKQHMSLAWRIRCQVLSHFSPSMIHKLAQLKHSFFNIKK